MTYTYKRATSEFVKADVAWGRAGEIARDLQEMLRTSLRLTEKVRGVPPVLLRDNEKLMRGVKDLRESITDNHYRFIKSEDIER